jgi:hypothetical protein
MSRMNAVSAMVLMLAACASAQNAPSGAAPKPSHRVQPTVFIPPATRIPVATMQRRVAPGVRSDLPQIPRPAAAVVIPTSPRHEPELVIPAAAPATAHGTGELTVDFSNGELSVFADDAELGKVLHQIGEKTGASVEVAAEIAGERVMARLGPGPAPEIVSTLLSSPRLDFILMGSEDQSSIKRLIVRRKASFGRELPQVRPAPLQINQREASAAEAQPEAAADQPAPEPQQQTPPR